MLDKLTFREAYEAFDNRDQSQRELSRSGLTYARNARAGFKIEGMDDAEDYFQTAFTNLWNSSTRDARRTLQEMITLLLTAIKNALIAHYPG